MTSDAIAHGTSTTRGNTHVLRFALHLPHSLEQVWSAVATPRGLRGWLAAADVLEPRLGGAVTLRWLNGESDSTHSGTVTAWEVQRVAEYTIDLHGRVRFHLEPVGSQSAVVRFTNEFQGPDSLRLDCLAGWHHHFELLYDALEGAPKDWSTWTLDRWQELRTAYEVAGGKHA
jgi:uncharacterized protein YndB with AHSA1/START domain